MLVGELIALSPTLSDRGDNFLPFPSKFQCRSNARFRSSALIFGVTVLLSCVACNSLQCCRAGEIWTPQCRPIVNSGATVQSCMASWTSHRWAACHVSECQSVSCRRDVQRTVVRWLVPTRCVVMVVAAAACRSASVDRGTGCAHSPLEHTETSPVDRRCNWHPSDHTHLINQSSIFLLLGYFAYF